MALRRALASLAPRVPEFAAPLTAQSCQQQLPQLFFQQAAAQQPWANAVEGPFRTFASDAVQTVKVNSDIVSASEISLSPTNKITYNEFNHSRFAPGTEGRPFAYLVQTGGRFLYASALRLAVLKVVMSMSAAADTLALGSLEVDLANLEEGSTITVKWRGKPVFIKYRTDEEIAEQAATTMAELKDPQTDLERVVDPKYLIIVGICTHLGCVPIAGAGNYAGGWFCPCHGSHYDGSGRVREGPAPYNLEVPEYKFMEGGKLIIG